MTPSIILIGSFWGFVLVVDGKKAADDWRFEIEPSRPCRLQCLERRLGHTEHSPQASGGNDRRHHYISGNVQDSRGAVCQIFF